MAVQDPGRTSFTCSQCGMVCPDMPGLLEHMDAHHQQEEERKFKCDQCGRGYRHAGSLTNHKKTHEVGSFQCCICGKENWNASALKSHLRSHNSFKKYSCAECGKAFRLATQLATHEKVHRSGKPRNQSFRNIDTEYPTRETENDQHHNFTDKLNNAGISMENSSSSDKTNSYNSQSDTCDDAVDRPFRCDLCDKSYIHHRSLINHRKTHQLGVFECTVCFKLFKNMAAFYSHQRTHKARSRSDLSLTADTNTTLDQLPKHNQDAPLNFCHLCQVCFPNEEEFQEHIQMHNSSSVSIGLQDTLSDKLRLSYDNSIASPESSFCASPINAVPSVSPVVNLRSFDPSQEQMTSTDNGLLDFSADQKPFSSSVQEGAPVMHTNTESPTHVPQNIGETSAVESDERPFKCHICGKSYRHSGSLINHKRSHQVGIYRCSICSKTYPHLAALKSHLRLHKAQPSSFNVAAEGDWLSSEPLTLHNQPGCFSSQNKQEDGAHSVLGVDQETGVDVRNGAFYEEQFNQDFSQDAAHIPHKEEVTPRHMCADCGETFTDIAGIKSHSCPLLQQRHETTINEYPSSFSFQFSNGHFTVENPGSSSEMHGLNGSQSYFEQNFHENANSAQLDVGRVDDSDEEDEDGEHYQCSICGNNYSSMSALKSHLQGHTQSHDAPPSSGPSSLSSSEAMKDDELGEMMICSSCGESFASRQDLISHQLLHNKDQTDRVDRLPLNGVVSRSKEKAQIICGRCGIFCSSSDHLDNHVCTSETKDESGRLKEEMEINSVSQREETSVSRETVDGEDRRYKCDQCGRSYRHAGSLLNHKKSHKTGVFRCVTCQKRFYNLLALKNHQRSHFDVKRHACHECGKAFKIQKQLLNHLKRHKENQVKIQELNSQLQALMQMNGSGSDGRRSTLASNDSLPLTCNGRRTQPAEGRAEHVKLETSVKLEDERDRRPFACDQCGRTYRHAGSLVNHRNSHKTGEYCCSVCNNTYSNQLAMKNHLRTHFANKKHLCQNCGKGFRGKKQLLAHTCADLRKSGPAGRSGLRRRTFKCKKCQKDFMSVDQLADHSCDEPSDCRDSQLTMSLSKEERPFKCSICNRTYRHAGSLLNHKNTHKTGHYSCTFCSKPFSNPMALRNHTRIHTQKKKYVCLTCGKAFRLASVLRNHQRVHNRALSHFSCSSCGKSFQGRSGLKRHRCHKGQESNTPSGVQQSERADRRFMCDLVEPSYHHTRSPLNHKKSNTENLHHCTLCLQTFPDPLALHAHSQMRRQCCPECGKTFCVVAHLQSHMETHSKEQVVRCSLCQQSFPNAASYQEHHDTHHAAQCHQDVCEPVEKNLCWDSGIHQSMEMGKTPKQVPPPLAHLPESITDSQSNETSATEEKNHVCEHCGRSYRHAGSLLNHKNSHKMGSFFCSVCQKEFTNLMALKNHRRIHTEPKRYQCLECGKAFRVSTQLICHRRIHTKEKPFACMLCSKTFSSKSNLRHHQKLHQNASQTYDSSFNMDANTFLDLDMESFL